MTVPAPCPCCGAYSLDPASQASSLLAVCDVLVVHALEKVGKWIINRERSRRNQFASSGRPMYAVHQMWRPNVEMIDKALVGAWDVVPALLSEHGCCDVTPIMITRTLDKYVRDLLITGNLHQLSELRYRFEEYLGITVPERAPYVAAT